MRSKKGKFEAGYDNKSKRRGHNYDMNRNDGM